MSWDPKACASLNKTRPSWRQHMEAWGNSFTPKAQGGAVALPSACGGRTDSSRSGSSCGTCWLASQGSFLEMETLGGFRQKWPYLLPLIFIQPPAFLSKRSPGKASGVKALVFGQHSDYSVAAQSFGILLYAIKIVLMRMQVWYF